MIGEEFVAMGAEEIAEIHGPPGGRVGGEYADAGHDAGAGGQEQGNECEGWGGEEKFHSRTVNEIGGHGKRLCETTGKDERGLWI